MHDISTSGETVDRVCHELRRPIAAIDAFAELLSDEVSGPLNAEQKAHLAVVRRNTQRLSQSVQDLFVSFYSMANDVPPRLGAHDLESLCFEIAEELDARFRERDVRLSILTEGPLVHPRMDESRLRAALVRLLENCLGLSGAGDGVQLKLALRGEIARIEVRDPGPCLSNEELGRVFDLFYRPERDRFEDRGGGGLSICRALLESFGARIWAENRAEGTTFLIELPPGG